MFVDTAVLLVFAGRGGDGSAHLHSEPYQPRAGPDGGDGGGGGDVVLRVDPSVFDLAWLADHPHQRAPRGGPGGRSRRTGATGADLVLGVPDGTVVRDERGAVADLVGEGASVVVARGGRGGRGSAALAGPRNRVPRVAEPGEEGEEHRVELELRLVADVGFVGLPNAGKSTLLAAVTAARPKIADYPFTTLTPNLGVAGEDERIVVADVPGLIEGAHEGRGLGLTFLRHVSRCRVLVYVADLTADPAADLAVARREVLAYDPGLGARRSIAVGTKLDLLGDDEREAACAGPVDVAVSGVTGEGVPALTALLEDAVRGARAGEPLPAPFVVLRPGRDAFTVKREGDGFRVSGRRVERWVTDTDLDDPRAVVALQRRLARAGVERRLMEEGARRGDEVAIGSAVFEFIPEEHPRTGGSVDGPADERGEPDADET